MAAIKHSLVITLDEKNDNEVFRGTSYIQKNVRDDEVVIFENRIEINYERCSIMPVEKLLDSPKSYIRTHLQRALGFYIAVFGFVPEFKKAEYTAGDISCELEKITELSKKWKNYRIETLLSRDVCKKIFEGKRENNVPLYNAVSFFIKAQLTELSHDSFRSAWSSMNALYTNMVDNAEVSEESKLKKLEEFILNHEMKNSCEYVGTINDEKFWYKLEWFYFLKNGFARHNFQKYYNDYFSQKAKRDAVLGEVLSGKLSYEVMTEKNKVDMEKIKAKAELYSKEKDNDEYIHFKDRVEFLVRKYCYFKRNRSMHAGQEYPLFIISEESENYIEPILVKLLIYAIKDIIEEKYT